MTGPIREVTGWTRTQVLKAVLRGFGPRASDEGAIYVHAVRGRLLASRELLAQAYGGDILLPAGFIVDDSSVWELEEFRGARSPGYRVSGRMADKSRVIIYGRKAGTGSRMGDRGWEPVPGPRDGGAFVKTRRRAVEVVVATAGTVVLITGLKSREAAAEAANSLTDQ